MLQQDYWHDACGSAGVGVRIWAPAWCRGLSGRRDGSAQVFGFRLPCWRVEGLMSAMAAIRHTQLVDPVGGSSLDMGLGLGIRLWTPSLCREPTAKAYT